MIAKDVPSFQAVLVETNDQFGPFGAKGIGEPGLVPTALTIANAIYDAAAVRIKDPPTPEKVLVALRKNQFKRYR